MHPASPYGAAVRSMHWANACARSSLALWQLWWTRNGGPAAVAAFRRRRLARMVGFARTRSPLYRDAYRGLPADGAELEALPVMTKAALMARFDDWVTDPSIRRRDVDAFIADRARVGERFLGRYAVWKSSGTTGEPGIYVQDDDALGVYDALIAAQLAAPPLSGRCAEGFVLGGGRAALIAATGEHFASAVAWERASRTAAGFARRMFSIMEPLDELVRGLNAFDPAFVASYPTMLALLADERRAGRLSIRPSIVWSAGECLEPPARRRLEDAFACPVINEYGASECMSIAFGCREGWLHVNADWVLLEPVDADFAPTPPGRASHTVLLTNLANRVQPLIRYDLGDAVVVRAEPCDCGNPLPAIRVDGRRDDIVVMRAHDDRDVRLVPQALATVVEESTGVHCFQIVSRGPRRLALRIAADDAGRRRAAFATAAQALRRYLANQGIGDARIALEDRPPAVDRRSGKLRQVIVEQPGRGARG